MYREIQRIKALQVLLFHLIQQSSQIEDLKHYEEFQINWTFIVIF